MNNVTSCHSERHSLPVRNLPLEVPKADSSRDKTALRNDKISQTAPLPAPTYLTHKRQRKVHSGLLRSVRVGMSACKKGTNTIRYLFAAGCRPNVLTIQEDLLELGGRSVPISKMVLVTKLDIFCPMSRSAMSTIVPAELLPRSNLKWAIRTSAAQRVAGCAGFAALRFPIQASCW